MGYTINLAKPRPTYCLKVVLNWRALVMKRPPLPCPLLQRRRGRGFLRHTLGFTGVLIGATFQIRAGIPPAEELLPQDTLFMVTAPDFGKLREIFQASPQNQLWNSPAMRPFKEKFLARWSEEFIKPLEHELDLRFDDYISLPQGQLTFAVTQN